MKSQDQDIPANVQELLENRRINGDYQISHNTREYHLVKNGSIVVHMNSGGAGYGDVLLRDPDSVVEDLRQEVISGWTASQVYKVVYDPETLAVDYAATEQARQAERADRLRRGKSYAEFEQEWLKKRPPEEALVAFGTWPEGKPTKKIVRI
jgi:acetophenone carboxylase